MPKSKRQVQAFSVSFLDCICCGFGAVILLFVLTSGKKSEARNEQLSDVSIDLGKLQKNIQAEDARLRLLASLLEENESQLSKLTAEKTTLEKILEDKNDDLMLLLTSLSELEESKDTLLGEFDEIPTIEEEVPVPIPNYIKRQYLTDFKMDGERVLIIVEASGGMLDDDTDAIIERLEDTDEEKRQAPKWQRVLRSVEWLLGSMRPPTQFQTYYFNREPHPMVENFRNQWLDLDDRETISEVLTQMKQVVPQGGANLERALWESRQIFPLPDNIILIVDGLPTLSDSVSGDGNDPIKRLNMYTAAEQQILSGVPINTILLPSGYRDPDAPARYWLLANKTKGSFISPSKTWPDT